MKQDKQTFLRSVIENVSYLLLRLEKMKKQINFLSKLNASQEVQIVALKKQLQEETAKRINYADIPILSVSQSYNKMLPLGFEIKIPNPFGLMNRPDIIITQQDLYWFNHHSDRAAVGIYPCFPVDTDKVLLVEITEICKEYDFGLMSDYIKSSIVTEHVVFLEERNNYYICRVKNNNYICRMRNVDKFVVVKVSSDKRNQFIKYVFDIQHN